MVIGHSSKVAARLHRAAQSTGLVTSTLGEVRQRADVVILWSADPSTTHPRHFERYSLFPKGRFVPRGRADRTLIWIGSSPNASRELADYVVTIAPVAMRKGRRFCGLCSKRWNSIEMRCKGRRARRWKLGSS